MSLKEANDGDKIQSKEQRFEFGANWRRFLGSLDDERIRSAELSLKSMLDVETLVGKKFLDIGSGSGLFSLAAKNLGATVHSFDYDPESVACTKKMRDSFARNGTDWSIEQGSVLDKEYMAELGGFDIVYSWGVLHHTGNMRAALRQASLRVRKGGKLFIAIYNDQGFISEYWLAVKKMYNRNMLGKWLAIAVHFPYLFLARYFWRLLKGKGRVERGMTIWYDMLDWLGGIPFEVATPQEIVEFFRAEGFEAVTTTNVGGKMGCNEFVFLRLEAPKV